ncbi:uncharacterized protein LOC131231386 [Magnolia sinica]|uniref:uncharacterized protein LOC131231386 n=1 Tax=Magnolia sinica TaxID=86752 RepID=UPI00265AFF18|nr:uncharacterized protein LOC131231386 [Magnolia sinica]
MGAVKRTDGAKYDCLLFDMDDTLYPLSSGLNLACRRNIEEYMLHHLHIEESEVPRMCFELYKEYGTTMAGLKALGYEFDDDEFHEYVHGRLPYETLRPDPVLRNLLLSMPQRKIIFTNADKAHAAQVLSRLELEDCFEGIICFETLNPPLKPDDDEVENTSPLTDDCPVEQEEHAAEQEEHAFFTEGDSETEACKCTQANHLGPKSRILCKPSLEAMEAAIRIANIDPKKTIFFDDSVRNIASGKAAGFHTVIMGSSELVPGADVALNSIHNIKEALPEIWEGDGEDQLEAVGPATTVETAVLA